MVKVRKMKLHLVSAILSHSFSSIVLSILLPFRYLVWRFRQHKADIDRDSVRLYQGTIWHERRHPVHHSFKLSARYALIDLDKSTNPPPNHLTAHQARQAAGTNGPVFLLTIPPSVGYQRSPVTLYYCYQNPGCTDILKTCILEVSNTPWAEKAVFSFNPNSDMIAKTLHISTYMDMLGNWKIKTSSPGENLFVKMSVEHPQLGSYFSASFTAKRLSSLTPIYHSFFFWLAPHKIVFITYWQALMLWWKKVPITYHPAYENSSYRTAALVREQELQCCFQINSRDAKCNKTNAQGHEITTNNDPTSLPSVRVGDRWFTWRETKSKWPWNSKQC